MVLLVLLGRAPDEMLELAYSLKYCDTQNILTEEFEVTLAANKLVEAYVRLECNTRRRVTKVGVVSRDDGEAFALGAPKRSRSRYLRSAEVS